ncbi:DUF2269 domain-containing protein [Brevundimonas sp.]|uniref:DUF2269 family protein n=1 Tax=Brevundimonas sp. TaxID=1871086 RepID=UPI002EDAC30E
MIDFAAVLKLIHVLSGAVLFGTGLGIAFFMVWATRTRSAPTVAAVARIVVVADFVFTATAVVIQPLTGLWLIRLQGYGLTEPWLLATYGLYGLTGLCWLPVVWIQQRMARVAAAAASSGANLPPAYDRLYWLWFVLGWPAFAAVIAIYALMLFKPEF